MKRVIDVLKALSAIAAAVLIYITASVAAAKGENILLLTVASVFAIVCTVLCFAVSKLLLRVANLEDTLGIYVDKGYENEAAREKTCKKCGSQIDEGFVICPFCGERDESVGSEANPYVEHISNERFQTEDPSYMGTDHSDDEVVSANFDSFDGE